MFKYCSLYSGSSGNSFYVGTASTHIIIDAGVSTKKISTALEEIDINGKDIDAILVTHDHNDHTKSIATLSNKYNIPVYANKKTWAAIPDIAIKIPENNKKIFNISEAFSIGDIEIFPFHTPHDAADPCGFNLYNSGKKISIATDIGHVENKLYKNLNESSFVLLESNYEPDMLKSSSYPYSLKHRILGPEGHLSNEDASQVIKSLVNNGLNNIMLGHLSKENNFPELAYQTTINELIENNVDIDKLQLSVADRDKVNKVVEIKK